MRAVNLLPKDANRNPKSIKSEDPAVVIGAALGAAVLIALGGGFLNVHGKVGHNQQQLDAARSEYARLSAERKAETPVKPIKQKVIIPVPAVTSEEGPRLDAVKQVLDTRISWDRILREFSLVLPDDVTITSLTMAAPVASTATTGAPTGGSSQGLSISGSAFSHDGVARLMSRLMLIPDLENVTLGNSTAGSSGDTGVQFSITASIKGAVAPAVDTTVPVTPTTPAATTTTSGGA